MVWKAYVCTTPGQERKANRVYHRATRMQVALMLAAKPPIALALAKRAVYESERQTLPEVLAMEMEHQLTCFKSADAREGLHAFLEKRPPAFDGT